MAVAEYTGPGPPATKSPEDDLAQGLAEPSETCAVGAAGNPLHCPLATLLTRAVGLALITVHLATPHKPPPEWCWCVNSR
jgi:hypothetical protein